MSEELRAMVPLDDVLAIFEHGFTCRACDTFFLTTNGHDDEDCPKGRASWDSASYGQKIEAFKALVERPPAGMALVPQSLIEAAIDTYEGEWGRANQPDHWTNEARKLIGLSALPVLGEGR